MKILAVFDANNYDGTTAVTEKYSVRGIVVRDGEIAMQYGGNEEYKIPGGGREGGETFEQALVREIGEETGLVVQEDSICELGEIQEIHRDIFDDTCKYICHTLFYCCKVTEERVPLHLTASEQAKGYCLKWASPEEICRVNKQTPKDAWIMRDTAFIEMIADGKIELPYPL